jgi:hypothetical protein
MKTKTDAIIYNIDEAINCLLNNEEKKIKLDDQLDDLNATARLLKSRNINLENENAIAHIETLLDICNTALGGNNDWEELRKHLSLDKDNEEELNDPSFLRKLYQLDGNSEEELLNNPSFLRKMHQIENLLDNLDLSEFTLKGPVFFLKYSKFLSTLATHLTNHPNTPPSSPTLLSGYDLARTISTSPLTEDVKLENTEEKVKKFPKQS